MRMVTGMLTLMIGVAAAAAPVEEAVHILDPSTFDSFVKDNDFCVVKFFAPWCGHCKRLGPEWSKAAERTAQMEPPVPLAEVDCDDHGDLCQRFGVSGYPTILVFKGGAKSEYDGPREADGIVSWVKKNVPPRLTRLATVEQAKTFVKANPVTVIGFFRQPVKASNMFRSFSGAASELQDRLVFAYSAEYADNDVATNYGLRPPRVIMISDHGEKEEILEISQRDFSVEKLVQVITAAAKLDS